MHKTISTQANAMDFCRIRHLVNTATSATASPINKGAWIAFPNGGPLREVVACAVAVIVKTDVAAPFAGTLMEEGLNAHEIRLEELEHQKFTAPSNHSPE